MIGRITYWNNFRGYGFIKVIDNESNGTREQYFFHHSNFTNGETPMLGKLVVFDLGDPIELGKRAQAVNIHFAKREDITTLNKKILDLNGGLAALAASEKPDPAPETESQSSEVKS